MGYLIFRAKLPTLYFLCDGCAYYGHIGPYTHTYILGNETQITVL